tara:strand:- start:48 stop:320 length:273 start_codon:yes stop_codon:yes gene_type:complete
MNGTSSTVNIKEVLTLSECATIKEPASSIMYDSLLSPTLKTLLKAIDNDLNIGVTVPPTDTLALATVAPDPAVLAALNITNLALVLVGTV